MSEKTMTPGYPRGADLDAVVADQFEELIRAESVQASAGQHGGWTRTYIDEARRADLWLRANELHGVMDPPAAPAPAVAGWSAPQELDTGYITFGGGVPVGGYSHLSIFPDGTGSVTGHFHDSGGTSYDVSHVWGILPSVGGGQLLTVQHTGRVHGTFESGSRDNNWGPAPATNADFAYWWQRSNSYRWAWHASASLNVAGLVQSIKDALGYAGAVIAILA